KEFVDVINEDIAAGQNVEKTYSFEKVSLRLFLPKFSSQASRLVGVSLTGTTTLTSRDSTGRLLSQTTVPYSKSWGLTAGPNGGSDVIVNNFTDLSPAP
ncbi:MAG: hypothetical protein M3077_14045, partial [Candidatus Dormibacteraeota bacterium]|nr:hypothetical protein [Candidatus Dormibacteraeota bacterium]